MSPRRDRELEWLREALRRASGSDEVGAVFDVLVGRVGLDEASRLWWAVFGATDAPKTG